MTNDICGIDFKRRSATRDDLGCAASRGATTEGSRGFEPTVRVRRGVIRRGATGEWGVIGGAGVKRRAATRDVVVDDDRGLKPTATVMGSLRDQGCRSAADDGSRAFQRPDKWADVAPRRVAAVELADLNQDAAAPAKKIQNNFEELGV